MFRVFKSPKFKKVAEKSLDKIELEELETFINELKQGNTFGRPLSYPFFREKKIGGKRIYFLVYDEIQVVLLVNVSNKKYQQETIDEIKFLFPAFKKYAYDLYGDIEKTSTQ